MSDNEDNYSASESDSEPELNTLKKTHKKSAKVVSKNPVLSDNDSEASESSNESDDEVSVADSKDDTDMDDIDPEDMDENALFADIGNKGKQVLEDDEFQFGFQSGDDEDEDDSDLEEDTENYLQKLDQSVRQQTIANHHPELIIHNYDEVEALTTIVRNEHGTVVDPLHRTLPFLSKYERTRILGERAKQINDGAAPFITVDPTVIDGYIIALKELEEKKLPFIIRRPLNNGASEYWKLKDLEFL